MWVMDSFGGEEKVMSAGEGIMEIKHNFRKLSGAGPETGPFLSREVKTYYNYC